jgi:hypothetical protein
MSVQKTKDGRYYYVNVDHGSYLLGGDFAEIIFDENGKGEAKIAPECSIKFDKKEVDRQIIEHNFKNYNQTNCPYCNSESVENVKYEYDDDLLLETEIICKDCKESWVEIWSFNKIRTRS